MRVLDVALIDERILHGRVDLRVSEQTLNLLDFPQGRDALTPDPDPVSPAPVLEQWEDDPYIRAYQAGKYDAAEQYQEGDAEDYIPLDKAVFDLTQ